MLPAEINVTAAHHQYEPLLISMAQGQQFKENIAH